MTRADHNRISATENIISSINSNNTSSDSENGTTHTSEIAGEEQPNISDNPLNQENVQKEKAKSVIIIGDSMIKHVNGWDLSKKLKPKCKVMVRSFPGATAQCVNDYVKPSIRAQTDHFILHVWTNDLISDSAPAEVARKVFDMAGKSDTYDVTISELIIRMDNPDLEKKRIEVNTHLKEICKEKNIFLIDHGKRIKANHLNSSKIHLIRGGANILSNTFIQHISKVFK